MNAATDSVRSTDRIQFLNDRDRLRRISIKARRNSLLKTNRQATWRGCRFDFAAGIRGLRQMLPGIVRFFSADTRAPHPFVDAVFLNLLWEIEAVPGKKFPFVGATEREIADRRNDFQLRRERAKGDVETHLVVSRTCRAVGERSHAKLQSVPDDCFRLANTLRADRERINAAAQNIARQQIAQVIAKQFLARVDGYMRGRTEIVRQFLDAQQIVRRKSASIDRDGVHVALLFPQPHHAERSVEAAAESQERFHSQSKRRAVVLSRKPRR